MYRWHLSIALFFFFCHFKFIPHFVKTINPDDNTRQYLELMYSHCRIVTDAANSLKTICEALILQRCQSNIQRNFLYVNTYNVIDWLKLTIHSNRFKTSVRLLKHHFILINHFHCAENCKNSQKNVHSSAIEIVKNWMWIVYIIFHWIEIPKFAM